MDVYTESIPGSSPPEVRISRIELAGDEALALRAMAAALSSVQRAETNVRVPRSHALDERTAEELRAEAEICGVRVRRQIVLLAEVEAGDTSFQCRDARDVYAAIYFGLGLIRDDGLTLDDRLAHIRYISDTPQA